MNARTSGQKGPNWGHVSILSQTAVYNFTKAVVCLQLREAILFSEDCKRYERKTRCFHRWEQTDNLPSILFIPHFGCTAITTSQDPGGVTYESFLRHFLSLCQGGENGVFGKRWFCLRDTAIFVIFVGFRCLRRATPCFCGQRCKSLFSPFCVKTTCFR